MTTGIKTAIKKNKTKTFNIRLLKWYKYGIPQIPAATASGFNAILSILWNTIYLILYIVHCAVPPG